MKSTTGSIQDHASVYGSSLESLERALDFTAIAWITFVGLLKEGYSLQNFETIVTRLS
jgi:hypothetical protein